MSRAPPISVMGFHKRYGSVNALRGLDLDVSGGIFGLIGPNGAGKTTFLRILLGLVKPDAGTGRVLGFDVLSESEEIRKRVGVLHEKPIYPRNMSVESYLDKVSKIYNVQEYSKEMFSTLELKQMLNRKIGALSAGMLQKLGIVQAMFADPELVFLDEPTSNLDVTSRDEVNRLIIQLNQETGTSFVISSHVLAELEKACHHVAFIKEGQIIEKGSVPEIIQNFSSGIFRIVNSDCNLLFKNLASIQGLIRPTISGANVITFSIDSGHIGEVRAKIEKISVQIGVKVYAIEPVQTLEEAFRVIMK
jgi:ABC-type multidrug transport system ATPase subunit